jgi:hypothetical protein
MLTLLPIGILLFTTLVILIIRQVRPGYGQAWLVALGGAFLAWCVTLTLRWVPEVSFSALAWLPVAGGDEALSFRIDNQSWAYGFALITLLFGAMLTVPARPQTETMPGIWAASVGITTIGLLAVFSGSPLTLVLAWSILDIAEIVILAASLGARKEMRQAITTFAVKVLGTFLVLVAMILSRNFGQLLSFTTVSQEVGIWLLLAVGLRLGVIPLHLPYTKSDDVRLRRELGSIFRLTDAASSLFLLTYLPPTVVKPSLAPYLLFFTSLAACFGAVRWFFSDDVLDGRPYWIISFAGLAIGSAIRGHPEASTAWGLALVLGGGILFLYSIKIKRIVFIPFLAVMGVIGLPYTPAASGMYGLIVLPFSILDIFLLVAHVFLLLGMVKQISMIKEQEIIIERWVFAVYPIGLFLFVLAQWLTIIFGWPGGLVLGNWWASLISLVLFIGIVFWLRQRGGWGVDQWISSPEQRRFFKQVSGYLAQLLQLDWIYRIIGGLLNGLTRILRFASRILEGDGGVLWALLVLTLIMSLISLGGTN